MGPYCESFFLIASLVLVLLLNFGKHQHSVIASFYTFSSREIRKVCSLQQYYFCLKYEFILKDFFFEKKFLKIFLK